MSQNCMYHKIFVALDGSKQQESVLRKAIELADHYHCELYIGYVIYTSTLETPGVIIQDLIKNYEQDFRSAIEHILQDAQQNKQIPSIKILVRVGRIRETLTDDMLEVINPDLVICGARGLSSIKYALLGSISTYLARTATCDTLIVKN